MYEVLTYYILTPKVMFSCFSALCKSQRSKPIACFVLLPFCVISKEAFSHSTHLCDTGSCEGYYHSHHVDCQLELEEFGDAVIDISPPHHSLDNTGEIVICQDDVRGLFGYVCPSNALKRQSDSKM